MNRMKLAERMWDAGVRIATAIHVVGAAADPEGPSDAFAEFIDHADKPYVIEAFSVVWPDYQQRIEPLLTEYARDKREDRRGAQEVLRIHFAELFLRACPTDFVVQVEHQVKLSVRPGERFPLGAWASGWGYTRLRWVLANSVEDAIEIGISIATAEARKSWESAKQAAAKDGAL